MTLKMFICEYFCCQDCFKHYFTLLKPLLDVWKYLFKITISFYVDKTCPIIINFQFVAKVRSVEVRWCKTRRKLQLINARLLQEVLEHWLLFQIILEHSRTKHCKPNRQKKTFVSQAPQTYHHKLKIRNKTLQNHAHQASQSNLTN